jgi:hypothetical protein
MKEMIQTNSWTPEGGEGGREGGREGRMRGGR